MRRFCSPYTGLRSKTRAAKMWVEGAVGGAADLGDRNPGAAEGGGAYTDLLCAVVPFFCSTFLLKLYIRIILCFIASIEYIYNNIPH
jgi:hypothetical protein